MDAPAGHDILLVEDNPADVDLFRLAIEESEIQGALHVATTGEEAISLLDPATGDTPSFDLIVLDLDLPGKTGLDVLEAIQQTRPIETTPVIVLSTSDSQREIQAAYERGANAYLTKRSDFEDTMSLVATLDEFWLSEAELPE